MADSFNPYRDWLGLADGQRPATHYGLFGLKPLESDAAEIRNAISRLLAKVRGIHPGNRTREWQAIIKELSLAKACLNDPAAKAAYDAQLRARGGATAAAAPPAAKGQQRAPAKPPRTTKVSKTPVSPKDSRSSAPPPAAGSGVSSPATPTTGAGGPPQGYQGYLPPIPPAPPDLSSLPPTASAAAGPAELRGYQGYLPPIPPAPADFSGLPPADSPQVGPASPDAVADSIRDASFAPDPDANQFVIPVDVFWDPRMEEVPEQTWTVAGVTIVCLLSLLVVLGGLTGFVLYQRYSTNVSLARVQQPKQAEVAKPLKEPPRPTVPDPGKSAAEDLTRKKASLKTNLTELVTALARRDLSRAQALVTQARANAQAADDQKTVDKYEKLSTDVREFWRIIAGRVSKFQPSEEVSLGKTRIIVVEARDGRFSFRYGSKILSYTAETLPTWLVIALADGNLAADGLAKELYGAFLAVDPEGDRVRAQSLWSEAAKLGIKIDELLPALDSLPATAGP